jgi:5-methyltetrahydrofolate--homocysteine methyltransferase
MDPLRPMPTWQKLARAKQLRRDPTGPERQAWSLLRNRRLLGLKFRRQHVLHGFIVDFLCMSQKLVLELDGSGHESESQAEYDAARTERLRADGYAVIRIKNKELSRLHLERLVRDALRPKTPPVVPPLPKGEGARG